MPSWLVSVLLADVPTMNSARSRRPSPSESGDVSCPRMISGSVKSTPETGVVKSLTPTNPVLAWNRTDDVRGRPREEDTVRAEGASVTSVVLLRMMNPSSRFSMAK